MRKASTQWTIPNLVGETAQMPQSNCNDVSCHAGTDSLKFVAEYVQDLKRKWFLFGLSLGLCYSTLKDIEASHHHDVGDCINGVIMKWLEGKGLRGPPSWRSLAQAMASPLTNKGPVAQKIEKEHLHSELEAAFLQ